MSLTRDKRFEIKHYIMEKLDAADSDLVKKTSTAYGISDKTVYRYLKELAAEGLIFKEGRRYFLKSLSEKFELDRLESVSLGEDIIYKQTVLKYIQELPENVRGIWDYAFTEVMNNALEHSEAEKIFPNELKKIQSKIFLIVSKNLIFFI